MADSKIQVIKLKVRRGTNAQRLTVKLDQGELGYTTDTQRLFVGDGTTLGGINVGNKIFTNITSYNNLTATNAQVGDIVFVNGVIYQLIAANYTNIANWIQFSPSLDSSYLEYSNNTTGVVTIKSRSIDGSRLDTVSLSSNTVTFDNDTIKVNFNTTLFNETSGFLSISDNSISARHISKNTLGIGLSGGNGNPIFVNIDDNTLKIVNNKLVVASTPLTALRVEDLGLGFDKSLWDTDRTLRTIVASVCSDNFVIGDQGVLALLSPPLTTTAVVEMPFITVERGYIAGISSSIYDILSADDSNPTTYNGSPNQVTGGYIPVNTQTTVTAISSSGPVSLMSAGFIVFQGGRPTRNNSTHIPDRFAIPVFTIS